MRRTMGLVLITVLLCSLPLAAANAETVHFLDILHNIRVDVGYYDSVDDAFWAMLDDGRVDLGFLRRQLSSQDIMAHWPAAEALHEELTHFILFSAAVEIAEVNNPSRLDPTLRDRLTTLASHTYTIASSPATGIAQVILEVSLDRFARGVYASVNQRFWTQYQQYQARHSQQDVIGAMEQEGTAGLFSLLDAFWEQEEVEYARQLRALEDMYPNARDAYRFQYIHEYLLAPPDPLLAQWMRRRQQESSQAIIEYFHSFVTQWQNTPVRITGRVVEQYLPEHPVEGSMLITWADGHSETAAVNDGSYQWQGPLYLLWNGVAADWEPLGFQFQRTTGALQDHYIAPVQTTLPVLLRAAGITMSGGRLETSLPTMQVMHFCDFSLAEDVRFQLYGPRVSRSQATDQPGPRPYGRYQLVVGSASSDVALDEPAKVLAIPGATAIPDKITWQEPDMEQILQQPDPLEAFLAYEQQIRSAMLARVEILMGEIRRLREERGDAAGTDEQIQRLEAERELQREAMNEVQEGETAFRETLQAYQEEQRERQQERSANAQQLQRVYIEMERIVRRLGTPLRDFNNIGRQALLWSGMYSRAWWDEARFEQQEAQDLQALERAADQFGQHWAELQDLRREAEDLRSQDYDDEWLEHDASAQTRTAARNMTSYGQTMTTIDAEEEVTQMKEDITASIARYRELPVVLEELLAAMADLLDEAPAVPDGEAAEQTAVNLEELLLAAASTDAEETDMTALQDEAAAARRTSGAYLPQRHTGEEGWLAQMQWVTQEIQYYRPQWGMHGQKISDALREGFTAMSERQLPALEQALDDVDLYMGYAATGVERRQYLSQLLTTADGHLAALDDAVSYNERMQAVLAAWKAVTQLPSHWRQQRIEPVQNSFELLLSDAGSLRRFVEATNRLLVVWDRVIFGHGDDAPVLELEDAVRHTLGQEHWEEANQGLRLFGTVVGAETPLNLGMTIIQGNGFQRALPRTQPALDGRFELFAPGTQNPDFGMQALLFQHPLSDPFYDLLSQVPLIQWEQR